MNAVSSPPLLQETAMSEAKPQPDAAPTFLSAEIGQQIAEAIAAAQGMMASPVPNRTATFMNNGERREYRYVTLSAVNEMIRRPLADNGLALLQMTRPARNGRLFLVTCLLHRSGQRLESLTPIEMLGQGPQSFGSALTYARRQAICGLLNIAADQDDDGSVAQGHDGEHADAGTDAEDVDGGYRQLRKQLRRLIEMANAARTPLDISHMLAGWRADMASYMAFRDDPEREEDWHTLIRLLPSAIRRVFGPEMADFWRGLVLGTTQAELDVLRVKAAGEWKAARERMEGSHEAIRALLSEHIRMQAARVERLDAEAGPPEAAPPAEQGFHLVDQDGEAVTDLLTSRMEFAEAYAQQHDMSFDKLGLATRNSAALAWCQDAAAAAHHLEQEVGRLVLDGARTGPAPIEAPASPAADPALPAAAEAEVEPLPLVSAAALDEAPPLPLPEPVQPARRNLVVEMPRTGRGTFDLGRYLLACKARVSLVEGAEELDAWKAANAPTYEALPSSTRLMVLSYIVSREQILGVAS